MTNNQIYGNNVYSSIQTPACLQNHAFGSNIGTKLTTSPINNNINIGYSQLNSFIASATGFNSNIMIGSNVANHGSTSNTSYNINNCIFIGNDLENRTYTANVANKIMIGNTHNSVQIAGIYGYTGATGLTATSDRIISIGSDNQLKASTYDTIHARTRDYIQNNGITLSQTKINFGDVYGYKLLDGFRTLGVLSDGRIGYIDYNSADKTTRAFSIFGAIAGGGGAVLGAASLLFKMRPAIPSGSMTDNLLSEASITIPEGSGEYSFWRRNPTSNGYEILDEASEIRLTPTRSNSISESYTNAVITNVNSAGYSLLSNASITSRGAGLANARTGYTQLLSANDTSDPRPVVIDANGKLTQIKSNEFGYVTQNALNRSNGWKTNFDQDEFIISRNTIESGGGYTGGVYTPVSMTQRNLKFDLTNSASTNNFMEIPNSNYLTPLLLTKYNDTNYSLLGVRSDATFDKGGTYVRRSVIIGPHPGDQLLTDYGSGFYYTLENTLVGFSCARNKNNNAVSTSTRYNTIVGSYAGGNAKLASSNTLFGKSALEATGLGDVLATNNLVLGAYNLQNLGAGATGATLTFNNNIVIGTNIAITAGATTTAQNNIYIGVDNTAIESNHIKIGLSTHTKAQIYGIYSNGVTSVSSEKIPVVDSNGVIKSITHTNLLSNYLMDTTTKQVQDAYFKIVNSTTNSKALTFDLSNIGASSTASFEIPNASYINPFIVTKYDTNNYSVFGGLRSNAVFDKTGQYTTKSVIIGDRSGERMLNDFGGSYYATSENTLIGHNVMSIKRNNLSASSTVGNTIVGAYASDNARMTTDNVVIGRNALRSTGQGEIVSTNTGQGNPLANVKLVTKQR